MNSPVSPQWVLASSALTNGGREGEVDDVPESVGVPGDEPDGQGELTA